jgi:hypothetical protein
MRRHRDSEIHHRVVAVKTKTINVDRREKIKPSTRRRTP